MLTQEEQLAMVDNAAGQSPTLSKRIAHFRESSGLVEDPAEISVHTHPHREPPSDTDVALTAETTRKSHAHSKRLAVNRDAMYLLIATKGTHRLMKSKFHGEWKEMRAAVRGAYQSHSPSAGPSGAGERMLHAMEQKALAAASAAKLVVYKHAGSSSTFERLVP